MSFILSNGGLRGAKKIKSAMGSDRTLSQVIEPGNSYRLFFKLVGNEDGTFDLPTVPVMGYNLDHAALKHSFVLVKAEEAADGSYKPLDTALSRYHNIAMAILKGSEKVELEDKEKKLREESTKLGKPFDSAAFALAQADIKLAYEGDREKNMMPTKKPAIGGLVVNNYVQCLVCKYADGVTNFTDAKAAIIKLSNKKMDELLNILSNNDFPKDEYLEVHYDYKGESKAVAGRNASLQGVARENSTKTKLGAQWEAIALPKLSELSDDIEVIGSRVPDIKHSPSVGEVVSEFVNYVSKHQLDLLAVDINDEFTKKAAKAFIETKLMDSLSPNVQKLFGEITIDDKSNDNKTVDEVKDEVAAEVGTAIQSAKVETLSALKETAGDKVDEVASASLSDFDGLI